MPKGLLRGFLGGLATGVGQGAQQAGDAYLISKISEDPNLTPIQKASIIASKNPQLGAQMMKQSQQQQLIEGIATKYPQAFGQPGFTPGAPQQAARNAVNQQLPEPNIGFQPNIGQGGAQMNVPIPGVIPPQQQQQMQPEEPQDTRQIEKQKLQAAAELAPINKPIADQMATQAKELAKDRRAKEAAAIQQQQFQQKFQQGVYESEKSDVQKRNADFLKTVDSWRASLPFSRQALNAAENAVKTGDFSGLSKNNLAYLLGRPELKDAPAAQLDIALKQNLLDTLSTVSARFGNKWLEQMAFSAFPGYGRSAESNLTMVEALKASEDMKEALLQTADKISENDRKILGYEGPDFQKRVFEAAQPVLKNISDRTSYRTRSLYEDELSKKDLRDLSNKKPPQGTPLTRKMFQVLFQKTGSPEKAIERAKQLGYVIYPNSKVEEIIR